MNEMNYRFGVVAFTYTQDGKMLVMPGMAENAQKQEMVVGYHSGLKPVSGWENLAGAVENEDNMLGIELFLMAMLRETAEESGLVVSPRQLTAIKNYWEVVQLRGGVEQSFWVVAFELHLNTAQEEWLRLTGAKEYVAGDALRPRDEGMLATSIFAMPIQTEAVNAG